MTEIYNIRGRRVHCTGSARVLIDYARARAGVRRVEVRRVNGGGGRVTVRFANRARGVHEFAAFGVAVDWVSRRKAWGLCILRRTRTRVIFGHE